MLWVQGGVEIEKIDLRDERTGYSIMEEKGVRQPHKGKGKRVERRERKKGNRKVEEQ